MKITQQELFKIREARASMDAMNRARYDSVAKVIDFAAAYVTCITCDCCYDDRNQPCFCQHVCSPIDARDIYANMDRARDCRFWFPKAVGRRASGEEYDA